MKHIVTLVFVALFALFALPARIGSAQAPVQAHNGNQLLRECELASKLYGHGQLNTSELVDAMHCVGYLDGVVNTLWITSATVPGKGCIASIPDAVAEGELARVVAKYLNDHPNQLHIDYSTLVYIALEDAYPCSSSHK